MSKQAWSPEPWEVHNTPLKQALGIYQAWDGAQRRRVATCGSNDDDATRIVACVNACQGIKNPGSIGEALKALERIRGCEVRSDRRHSGMVDADVVTDLQRTARAALAKLEEA